MAPDVAKDMLELHPSFLLLLISLRKANGGHYYRWHQEYWLNSLDYLSSIYNRDYTQDRGLLPEGNLC